MPRKRKASSSESSPSAQPQPEGMDPHPSRRKNLPLLVVSLALLAGWFGYLLFVALHL